MAKRTDILVGVSALFIAAVGALLLVALNRAPRANDVVSVMHITAPIFGCQSLDTANQIGTLLSQHDEDAADQVIHDGLASGECAELSVGTAVYIEDRKPSGLVKARPQGNPTAYWTVSNAIGQ